jgi:hypothetical protein
MLAPAFRIVERLRRLILPAAVTAAVGFAFNLVAAFGM